MNIDATLDPSTRMQLILQKLKEANVLRATTPNATGEMVGGRFIAPIAEWTKQAFNRMDARGMDAEAMDALKQLDSDRRTAREKFATDYAVIDPENKGQLFKAAMAYDNNPLLEGAPLGELFKTLLKPQTSLFPAATTVVNGKQVTEGPTGAVVKDIPELSGPLEEERKLRMKNIQADNAARDSNMEYQRSENARKAEEHSKEMQIKNLHWQQEQDAMLAKADQEKYAKFNKATEKLIPLYESARSARGILEKYKTGEVPGYSLLGNAKALAGGVGMSPEEKKVRATFDQLQEFFQNYVTGAAAPDEQAKRIAGILGRQAFDSPENVRAVLPEILKFFDKLNKHSRSLLGTPEQASAILTDRQDPLMEYLDPTSDELRGTTTIDPSMSPENRALLEKAVLPADQSVIDMQQQAAIAKKLGVDPAKVRSVVKVK